MPERVVTCPHCTAPITPPSVFARSVVCRHCGATVVIDPASVSAGVYRKAYAEWTSPEALGYRTWFALGASAWALGGKLAVGGHSDVYIAERARWPTERAIVKVRRDSTTAADVAEERKTLETLHAEPGAIEVGVPRPIEHGVISSGAHAGRPVLVLRFRPGFVHTLSDAKRVYPNGVDPKVLPWIWRRVLEVLTFTHRAGFVHGAVAPAHVVVHEREHGAILVGWGAARPARTPDEHAGDIVDSARTIAEIAFDTGFDTTPSSASNMGAVPEPIANLIRAVAGGTDVPDAWTLRERVGVAARRAFGPPSFNPLPLP